MIKPPIAVDTTKHETGRRKSAVGARPRSKSVGKPKLEGSLGKQPFKTCIEVDEEAYDGDLPSRKHSVTSSQVSRQRSRSVGKPKLESNLDKLPFKSSMKLNDETRDWDVPSRKHSATSSQVTRQRSRSVGKPKLERNLDKLPFKSSIRLNDETRDWDVPSRKHSTTSSFKSSVKLNDEIRDWDLPSRKHSTTSSFKSSIKLNDETRDWDIPSRKLSTTSSKVTRQRSRSLGKTKMESSSVKLPFKSSIKLNERRDGDLPSRKSSSTSTRVKKYISQSSVVADDTRSLASTMENIIHDTKYRPLRTSSFTGYKSSTALHKVSSSRLPSVSSRYSRLSTGMDPRIIRHPKTSQYKVGDMQSYKLHDELETTDEEAMDSEFTDDADENDDAAAGNEGDAEGAVPDNPEGETGEVTEGGEPGDNPDGEGSTEAEEATANKVLLQFLVMAIICKAVSLFFQPQKCTC